jgi:hypothetical protein
MDLEQINQTLDIIFQVLMFVIPIAAALITWFLRTYVKSAESEKTVAAIVRLSNSAIDFAEDLDNRGELEKYLKLWNMPEDVVGLTSNGLKKLNLAGKWLESELGRMGVRMTDEEAQAWIASEFQKRVGDIGRERTISEQTGEAVSLLQVLQTSGLISLPTDVAGASQLANLVADWAIAQSEQEKGDLMREDALVRVRTQLTTQPLPVTEPSVPSLETQLAELARQSVLYVEQLEASHALTLPEVDIAVAWVLTEVTKRGLAVTTEQIAGSVSRAFAERGQQ